MKITKLVAENVKRLHAVEITPDGNLITIAGKNGAGKSSVLDSIPYALGGERLIPSEPIRSGETEAKIVVDLGEDLVVTRKFKRKMIDVTTMDDDPTKVPTKTWGPTTSTLTVTNKAGARYPSPQAVIDKLYGTLTFDPLAFARAESKEQDTILRALVGLDVTPIEARRKAAYDQRAALKKSHAIKAAQLAALPYVHGAPDVEIPMDEISNEMLAAERLRKAAEDAEREWNKRHDHKRQLEASLDRSSERIAEMRKQLAALEDEHAEAIDALDERVKELDAAKVAAEAARAAVPDADAIRVKITNTEVMNAAVRTNQKHAEAEREVEQLAAQVAETDAQVKQADQDKADALAAAQFPVEGLGLSDDGVTFHGLPFNQAGSAEQVRVSVAIGIALNPQLKVLLIRNGNLLDKDSLAAVAAQADAAGMQTWMEMVAEDKGEMTVMIVDGEVA